VDKECILFWEEGTRKGDVRGRLGLGGAVLEAEGTGGAGRVVDGAGFGDGRVRMDSRDVRRKEAWGGRASEMGWEGASAVWRRLEQVRTERNKEQRHARLVEGVFRGIPLLEETRSEEGRVSRRETVHRFCLGGSGEDPR